MFLSASEGLHWRYEVCEHSDGYLVKMRDLDTGELDEEFATVFRTMPVAFAYAEMSAAFDRYASARMAGEDAASELGDLEAQQTLYRELSRRLLDDGMAAIVLDAWERADEARDRRRFH